MEFPLAKHLAHMPLFEGKKPADFQISLGNRRELNFKEANLFSDLTLEKQYYSLHRIPSRSRPFSNGNR
jgi:hypothetical protein